MDVISISVESLEKYYFLMKLQILNYLFRKFVEILCMNLIKHRYTNFTLLLTFSKKQCFCDGTVLKKYF